MVSTNGYPVKNVLLMILFFWAQMSGAAKIIGNGGDVVVCGFAANRKIQMLDFYEAEKLSGLKLVNPGGLNYVEIVSRVLSKVGERFPNLAQKLGTDLITFENRKKILYDIRLTDISDSYHVIIPPNCEIAQIVNQREPFFNRQPWFIIDGRLWDQTDEWNRAGLVFHELIYKQGIAEGLDNSVGVRYLVGLFFSSEFARIGDAEWIRAFQTSRIRYYEYGGLELPLFSHKVTSQFKFEALLAGPEDRTMTEPETIAFEGDRLALIRYESPEEIRFTLREKEIHLQSDHVTFLEDAVGKVNLVGRLTAFDRTSGLEASQAYQVDGDMVLPGQIFCGHYERADLKKRKNHKPKVGCVFLGGLFENNAEMGVNFNSDKLFSHLIGRLLRGE